MKVVDFTIDYPSHQAVDCYGDHVATVYGHARVHARAALDPGETPPFSGTVIDFPSFGPLLVTHVTYSQWPYVDLIGQSAAGYDALLFPMSSAKITPPQPAPSAPVAMPKNPTPIFGKDTRRVIA
jgi:hypothetical protein